MDGNKNIDSLHIYKDSSKKYYGIELNDMLGSLGEVCFSYYEGAIFRELGLTQRSVCGESVNEVTIFIPNSNISPEGLYKNPKMQKKAYHTIMDFFNDNGINLIAHRCQYSCNIINDTIYKLVLIIPYRDLKKAIKSESSLSTCFGRCFFIPSPHIAFCFSQKSKRDVF